MTLQLYLNNGNLLFFLFFFFLNAFGRMDNRLANIIAVDGWWSATPGRSRSQPILPTPSQTPTPAKTVDSDRLRLRPKRSTPTDSDYGLDSDCAALITKQPALMPYLAICVQVTWI